MTSIQIIVIDKDVMKPVATFSSQGSMKTERE